MLERRKQERRSDESDLIYSNQRTFIRRESDRIHKRWQEYKRHYQRNRVISALQERQRIKDALLWFSQERELIKNKKNDNFQAELEESAEDKRLADSLALQLNIDLTVPAKTRLILRQYEKEKKKRINFLKNIKENKAAKSKSGHNKPKKRF